MSRKYLNDREIERAKEIYLEENKSCKEIANIIGRKLAWNNSEKNQFLNINKPMKMDSAEGY